MIPTNKLRWLKVQQKDNPWANLTLQQWWQAETGDWVTARWQAETGDWITATEFRLHGEWRDVEVVNE